MILLFFFLVISFALPYIQEIGLLAIYGLMPHAIVIFSLLMIASAVGMKISRRLGSTVAKGLFAGIGFLVKNLFLAISWGVKGIFAFTPKMFLWTKEQLKAAGMKEVPASLLAALITLIVI